MNIGKMSQLKKVVGELVKKSALEDFPKTIIFSRGIEHPKYKITIEQHQEDFFVDSRGVKWIRDESKEDDE